MTQGCVIDLFGGADSLNYIYAVTFRAAWPSRVIFIDISIMSVGNKWVELLGPVVPLSGSLRDLTAAQK